jgi:mannose-6-phosphate isomerase-like protein (cupin superfamily)
VLDGSGGFSGIGFLHDDLLPPGASIGEHDHLGAEETYLVIEGRGELVFDGRRMAVGPGDVSVCGPGHSHGIVNAGPGPLRLLVISVREQSHVD